MNKFKDNLRELRKTKNLSQLDIAKIFNVTKMCVSHWEKGNGQPDYDTLIKIAKFFDISTDNLLGIEDYDYNFQYEHNDTKLIHKEKK